MAARDAEDAVRAAREAREAADEDFSFWMRQYKRHLKDVREWVDAAGAQEDDSAPRFRLLQQLLQDTRHGLDCATRAVSEARTELSNARQFYLMVMGAVAVETAPSGASLEAQASGLIGASDAGGASSQARGCCAGSMLLPSMRPRTVSTAASNSMVERSVGTGVVQVHTEISPTPAAVQQSPRISVALAQPTGRSFTIATPATAAASSNNDQNSTDTTGAFVSPLKRRRGREPLFLVPCKRKKYPRVFEWDDKTMHHFPKGITIPVCELLVMWVLWVCGNAEAKYPPFRIMTPQDLEKGSVRRSLSSLRFVMMEIEARVIAKNAWVNNPTPESARGMLDTVKESLAVRRSKVRSSLAPVEHLKWTSLGRILRDQRRMQEAESDYDDVGEDEDA